MSLVAMARQNPALVQPLLEELSRNNPRLLMLVQENQADFMALLNGTEPITVPPTATSPAAQQPAPAAGAAAPPQGGIQIQVTPAERGASTGCAR